jgi:hypothetical protein
MSYPKYPINKYTCVACGGFIVTIDREAGTTPFMVRCRATKKCTAMMESSFYQVDQGLTPAYEWRKPMRDEYRRMSLAMKEHIDRGGLQIYPIGAIAVTNVTPKE